MKKLFTLCVLMALLCVKGWGQVSGYSFTQSSGAYTTITGTTGVAALTTTSWDDAIVAASIPFTFNFNGTGYTSCNVSPNGYLTFGATAPSGYNAISAATAYNGAVAAFSRDLINNGTAITYNTIGATPNRIFVIQWNNARRYSGGAVTGDVLNFQIRLYETSNIAEIVYGTCTATSTSLTSQVGLRGASNADYNNRSSTASWSATTAGTTNAATVTSSNTIMPASGLTFTYAPAVPTPRAIGTITATQQATGNIGVGTTNNNVLSITIPVTGNTGTQTLSSVTVNSANTNNADIAASGVKLWTGTSTAPTTQIGTAQSFSGGVATFSGLTTALTTTTYLWVTYDITSTATIGNIIDATIPASGITITAAGGATASGTQPPSALNPSGNGTIGYCTPTGGTSSTTYYLNSITTTGGVSNLSYTASSYSAYVNNTATSFSQTAGGTVNVSLASAGGSTYYYYCWVDWNGNGSFNDAGETIFATTSFTSTYSGSIPVAAGQALGSYRVRFATSFTGTITPCGPAPYGNYVDFTLNVTTPPTCTAPVIGSIGSVTSNSASVPFTCTSCNPGNAYIIEYGVAGFTPGAGTTAGTGGTVVTGTASPINISGLSSAITYDVYVRQNCTSASNGYSSNSAKATFTTLCAAVTSFSENFDGTAVNTLPTCWKVVGSTTTYAYASTSGYSSSPNSLYILYNSTTNRTVVSLPPVSNAGAGTNQLRFKERGNFSSGETIQVGYLTNSADASTFVSVTSFVTSSTSTFTEHTVDFGTAPGSNQYLAFRVGTTGSSVLIDDVYWETKPTCIAPTSPVVSNISTTTATFGWTASTSLPSSYEVYYTTSSVIPTSGTTPTAVGITTNTYSATGLTASTLYYIYVRSNCGGGWY